MKISTWQNILFFKMFLLFSVSGETDLLQSASSTAAPGRFQPDYAFDTNACFGDVQILRSF